MHRYIQRERETESELAKERERETKGERAKGREERERHVSVGSKVYSMASHRVFRTLHLASHCMQWSFKGYLIQYVHALIHIYTYIHIHEFVSEVILELLW